MTRPDPRLVPRRPQAQARSAVAYRQASTSVRAPFLADGRFDPSALYALLDEATLALEGAPDPADGRFFGSAVWRLALAPEDARRLATCIADDPRASRVVADQVHRELARTLGADLPAALEQTLTVAVDADGLRLQVEVEGAPLRRQVGAAR